MSRAREENDVEHAAESDDENLSESPVPGLPKEEEANQPVITSFFVKTLVKHKGKGDDQATGDDATSKKSAPRKEKIEAEKTIRAEPSPTKYIEEENKDEQIPLSKRVAIQPQEKNKTMMAKKSTRTAGSAINSVAIPHPISLSLEQLANAISQSTGETREEVNEVKKKGKEENVGTSKIEGPAKVVETNNAQAEQVLVMAMEEQEVLERIETESQVQEDTTPVKASSTRKRKTEGEPCTSSKKNKVN